MSLRRVTTWSLEMRDEAALRPAAPPRSPVELRRAETPSPEFARFLYTAVGGDHHWLDRVAWRYDDWLAWLRRPQTELWVALSGGNVAGYFELERQPVPDAPGREQVEIAYFGLLPPWVGRGVGGWLLTEALRRAWQLTPERVWVHTCTLDGEAALPNYRARGLEVCSTQVDEVPVADEPIGPWPGARGW
ncbi:MAG: GNAT family N-acetyltransferase [Candidatus Dormiibacterota bacterium]